MLVVVIFIVFILKVEIGQIAYIEKFKETTVEMDDFTLRVENLPIDNQFGSPGNLKAFLHAHFEKIIID
jgi:hypothetical protein